MYLQTAEELFILFELKAGPKLGMACILVTPTQYIVTE